MIIAFYLRNRALQFPSRAGTTEQLKVVMKTIDYVSALHK